MIGYSCLFFDVQMFLVCVETLHATTLLLFANVFYFGDKARFGFNFHQITPKYF